MLFRLLELKDFCTEHDDEHTDLKLSENIKIVHVIPLIGIERFLHRTR